MDIFQPDLENAIATYLHIQTGKEWKVKVERDHMDIQFICACEGWERSTRSIDLSKIDKESRMSLDELLAYWRTNNSQESND